MTGFNRRQPNWGDDVSKILLVSNYEKGSEVLKNLLVQMGQDDVYSVEGFHRGEKQLQEDSFDVVIVLSPSGEGDALDLCRYAVRTTAGVMLVTKQKKDRAALNELEQEGIYAYSTDLGKAAFCQAVRILTVLHYRLAGFAPQTQSLQDKIKEIRLVDRAKCLLIQYCGMTEEEAHHHIERQAMSRRVTRRQIAQEILDDYGS